MFTPHTPPESDTDEEPQLQSHSPKIPPLILTFNIDELLILYEYVTVTRHDTTHNAAQRCSDFRVRAP
jgi:hypothetical protein